MNRNTKLLITLILLSLASLLNAQIPLSSDARQDINDSTIHEINTIEFTDKAITIRNHKKGITNVYEKLESDLCIGEKEKTFICVKNHDRIYKIYVIINPNVKYSDCDNHCILVQIVPENGVGVTTYFCNLEDRTKLFIN